MPTDLATFFVWLAASGTVSGVISWLLANWPWFANLGDTQPLVQQAIKLAVSIGLSVLSWALTTYVSPDLQAKLQPLFFAIASGINIIIMQAIQGAHIRFTLWALTREIKIADDRAMLASKRQALKMQAMPPERKAIFMDAKG